MTTLASPRPPTIFNLPNQLTASRFVLSIVLFILISVPDFAGRWLWCLAVFIVAAITDWLDGYLARKQGLTSTLGRNLDPLVDKILICGLFVFLLPVAGAGIAPWMAVVVLSRELVVTSLRSFIENRGGSFGAAWPGKLKMVLQCLALGMVFIHLAAGLGEESWTAWGRDILVWAMIVSTVLSGVQYLLRATALLRVD